MEEVETLTPEQASKYLQKISAERIRAGLRQNKFPFGTAILGDSGQWTYIIIKNKFLNYIGIKQENLKENI